MHELARSWFCLLATAGLLTPAIRSQVEWTKVDVFGAGSAAGFDAARGRVLAVRGTGSQLAAAETWEWDGTAWSRIAAGSAPAARFSFQMAFDSLRQRPILFGGYEAGNPSLLPVTSTWTFENGTWTALTSLRTPPPRGGHAMVYDVHRDRVVLFGGVEDGRVALGDTWEWDGVDWRLRSPARSPAPRSGHAMTYDAVRQRTVMFGGGETWEWDGTTWHDLTPVPAALTPRDGCALAFDPVRNVTVLFGGSSAGQWFGETWLWDGSTWSQATPAVAPEARSGHAMLFDSLRGEVLLIGGGDDRRAYADVWAWNGSAWNLVSPPGCPTPVWETSGAAFDRVRGRTVLQVAGDTWEWDGSKWERKATSGPDPVAAMAFDAVRAVTVIFGGTSGDETWEWDGTAWVQRTPVLKPPARGNSAMAYDIARQRVVLYGGFDRSRQRLFDDTWEWDGSAWRRRAVPGPPTLRNHGMAYDTARQVTVVYGGALDEYGAPSHQTWEWNGVFWQRRNPVTTPVGDREFVGLVYDERRQRTVLFGGGSWNYLRRVPGTWEWDGVDWFARGTASSPEPRNVHAIAYDAARGRTVLFGGDGVQGRGNLSDTWELGPVHPAATDVYGRGCGAGTATAPALWTSGLPWLGATVSVEVLGVAATDPGFLQLGFSRTNWLGLPLPFPLDGIGMPGCDLLAAPNAAAALTVMGGRPGFSLPIPADLSLRGGEFFVQAVIQAPNANPAGLVVSDAAAFRIGGR